MPGQQAFLTSLSLHPRAHGLQTLNARASELLGSRMALFPRAQLREPMLCQLPRTPSGPSDPRKGGPSTACGLQRKSIRSRLAEAGKVGSFASGPYAATVALRKQHIRSRTSECFGKTVNVLYGADEKLSH
ncbi:hypothetical protein PYCCODRAFT_1021773 [Trametes coccinea BRFM310]|uniref:Uncharacterized protein n=1 Tax=Trametes coccinea (strain BRFM310) TaxID=1353009 RepID=A0A1Y2ICM3_TRAC3|nr:hypothetical protein PYCCODRAFT_1021773 [Trametes coccinea BRFM310]